MILWLAGSKSRNCESVIFEVATKKITKINTISISGVISILGFLFDVKNKFHLKIINK